MRLGFETYRSFAPPGWDPPPAALERSRIAGRLPLPDAWCRIAEAGGEPAGHVAILAARERTGERTPIAGVAHLWMLFVREPWWGSGLAAQLHALAVAEAAAQGYGAMQLDTPARQARARAFYEREGWRVDGDRGSSRCSGSTSSRTGASWPRAARVCQDQERRCRGCETATPARSATVPRR